MTLGLELLESLQSDILREFPDFKIVRKGSSTFMKVLDVILKVITLWKMTSFLTSFNTTIGYTVYVSEQWDRETQVSRMITLRHERVHMRQRKKYGFFVFAFLYLLGPVPGWRKGSILPRFWYAPWRSLFEQEAYAESMRALKEFVPYGRDLLMSTPYINSMVAHFTSAQYFWMHTDREAMLAWYYKVRTALEDEENNRTSRVPVRKLPS